MCNRFMEGLPATLLNDGCGAATSSGGYKPCLVDRLSCFEGLSAWTKCTLFLCLHHIYKHITQTLYLVHTIYPLISYECPTRHAYNLT